MSVAKTLMAGRILEEHLFPYPTLRGKDREVLGLMLDAIDQFLQPRQADFKRWDREAAQPAEFIQGLRDLGLFGLIIPEEHGGLGCRTPATPGCSARRVRMTARCRSPSARTAPSA